ncbi:hypothetical protein PENTCL1PPCAC_10857, partial [Pristionchus entomophagus]
SFSMPKIAVVQAGSRLYDTPATLSLLENYTQDAAKNGADLVLFPEAFVGGYPKGLDFGVVLGLRSDEGRSEYARYFNGAITAEGEESKRMAKIAQENNIWIVTGVVEKEGSTLYCSVFFYSSLGKLEAVHRKLLPTALERVVWGQGDGSTMPVIDSPVGKIGTAICWENYMPLYRVTLYSKGVEVYLAPTVDSRDEWLPTMQTIALEGRCFVVSSCQFLRARDFPDDHALRSKHTDDEVLIRGGSCAVNPLGKVLLTPDFTKEGMFYVDLDLSIIPKARFDLDPVGHYSRPDVFQLRVNEDKKSTVVFEK